MLECFSISFIFWKLRAIVSKIEAKSWCRWGVYDFKTTTFTVNTTVFKEQTNTKELAYDISVSQDKSESGLLVFEWIQPLTIITKHCERHNGSHALWVKVN